MIYIIFAVSSRENDRECVLLNAFMYLLIKKNMNRLQTRNEILKGQRNRAYAGLHATREELERVKASNGIMFKRMKSLKRRLTYICHVKYIGCFN